MKIVINTNSIEETIAFAKKLGDTATPGSIYALHGELGTGKTIIAKGIAAGLGIMEDITSPTFNLLEIYKGRIPLYHFDLYRIQDEQELDQLFFEEYWEGNGVSVIEWAERAKGRLTETTIHITIDYIDESRRTITIEYINN